MKIALIQQKATEDIESNVQLGLDNLDHAAFQNSYINGMRIILF